LVGLRHCEWAALAHLGYNRTTKLVLHLWEFGKVKQGPMQSTVCRIVCAIEKADHSADGKLPIEKWLAIVICSEQKKRERVNLVRARPLLALLLEHVATYSSQLLDGV